MCILARAPCHLLTLIRNGSFVAIVVVKGPDARIWCDMAARVHFGLQFCILGVVFGCVGPCVKPTMQAANLRPHNAVCDAKPQHNVHLRITRLTSPTVIIKVDLIHTNQPVFPSVRTN